MFLLLATSLILVSHVVHSIPTGIALYFDADVCPTGWKQLNVASGRLVVSVSDPSIAGVTVGTPLSDREDRKHTHAYATTFTIASKHIAADGCCDTIGAHEGTYNVANNSDLSASGYPFTQLLLCEFAGADDGQPLAFGTVAYFSPEVQQCPKGWQVSQNTAGRFVIPNYQRGGAVSNNEPPLASGEDRQHNHGYSISTPTESVSYVGVDGCCNNSPAGVQPIVINGTTSKTSAGLPYVQLLTCASQEQTFNLTLPTEALVYNAFSCPPGWEVENAVSGRFIVSLQQNGSAGAAFGGDSLPPTGSLNPAHQHTIRGTVSLPHSDIGLAEGCCAGGYMAGRTYSYRGNSMQSTDALPYTMLPLCRKKATQRRFITLH